MDFNTLAADEQALIIHYRGLNYSGQMQLTLQASLLTQSGLFDKPEYTTDEDGTIHPKFGKDEE